MVSIHKAIDKYFKISESGSSIKTEILSGITAYFTMVYLLFLVPTTLMSAFPEAFDETGEMIGTYILSNGVSANQMLVSLTVASCIAAAIGTLIMSFKANLPFVQGPSLAISTFISFTLCSKMGYTYNEALAAVFIGGIVFLIITIMGMEKKIQDSIPTNIKFAVTAGIGLFIAFMGMQKAHIVVPNSRNLVTLVDFADLTSYNTKSAPWHHPGVLFSCITALALVQDVNWPVSLKQSLQNSQEGSTAFPYLPHDVTGLRNRFILFTGYHVL